MPRKRQQFPPEFHENYEEITEVLMQASPHIMGLAKTAFNAAVIFNGPIKRSEEIRQQRNFDALNNRSKNYWITIANAVHGAANE